MWLLGRYIRSLLSPAWNGENCKMVIIVRSDLAMGKGKVGAQCAHAALECCRQTLHSQKKQQMFYSWLQIGQPKIVLQIQNEEKLLNLADKAQRAGLITAIIKDAGCNGESTTALKNVPYSREVPMILRYTHRMCLGISCITERLAE